MALNEQLENLMEQLRAMSPARLAALAATAAGSLAFCFWLTVGFGGPDERLLFRDLAEAEAARVVDALDAQKIPYRLAQGGSAVYVPASHVYEARIRLAGDGLPAGSSPGFEIFDDVGFGVTDFVNQVNYQRALQGELARSIEELEAVDRARVQVAVPDRRGFLSDRDRAASASVVVRLRGGLELEVQQARGIAHLVASSVEGLDPAHVTILDDRGRQLAPVDGGAGPAPTGALRHRTLLERDLAARIQSILEPTVGAGRVVARVSTSLDWTQTESTEERFDPDSQVARSEEITKETENEGGERQGGAPGIASNSPNAPGGGFGGATPAAERSTETVNYEISKVMSRTVAPVGTIQQLDVAVLVDGAPSDDGTFQAWDGEALQDFEQLAKRAVGFSEERGDRFTLTNAPFRAVELELPGDSWLSPELLLLASTLLRFAGIVVAVLLFAKLVAAPLGARALGDASAALPARAADLEMQLAGAGAESGELPAGTPASNQALPLQGGEEAVKALRAWLSER